MPRVLALALSFALTFTPAALGACAVLLCPADDGQAAPGAVHQRHHEPVAASVHVHHDMGHDVTAAAPRARVRALSAHGCCATDATFVPAPAVVTNRLNADGAIEAAVTASRADITHAGVGQSSSPPRHPGPPPCTVAALLVLRI
jgi:hypothetical protein